MIFSLFGHIRTPLSIQASLSRMASTVSTEQLENTMAVAYNNLKKLEALDPDSILFSQWDPFTKEPRLICAKEVVQSHRDTLQTFQTAIDNLAEKVNNHNIRHNMYHNPLD